MAPFMANVHLARLPYRQSQKFVTLYHGAENSPDPAPG